MASASGAITSFLNLRTLPPPPPPPSLTLNPQPESFRIYAGFPSSSVEEEGTSLRVNVPRRAASLRFLEGSLRPS